MMDNFAQILRRLPTGEASSSSGHATPFKVHVNFDIPLFEGLIDADVVDKWLNLLEGYFSVHNFSDREKITFSLLKVIPHVKDWWDTYSEQRAWRNLQFLWWPLHGIPSGTPLKNNTTLLEATRTSTPDGPPYIKKGTRQYQTSPIFSIPYAPNWVSNILSIIWCSNTMVVCIDTFKHKWSSWTSPHWARLIDTLSRSSINLSRNDESLDLQTPHSPKQGKGSPNPHSKGPSRDGHPQDNPSKPQHKKGNEKTKKDTGKWCEYHKIPWHNTRRMSLQAVPRGRAEGFQVRGRF
jgi:hypothetical protein